jgi:hypothetical protein
VRKENTSRPGLPRTEVVPDKINTVIGNCSQIIVPRTTCGKCEKKLWPDRTKEDDEQEELLRQEEELRNKKPEGTA